MAGPAAGQARRRQRGMLAIRLPTWANAALCATFAVVILAQIVLLRGLIR